MSRPLDPSAFEALEIERLDDVLRVTIDHPTSRLNAVDALLHGELARLFRELKREDDARAVLLTGRGPAFSAGGDFDWFPSLDDAAKLEHLRRDAKQMIWDLLDVELPIVVALNGPAVGLGASLALLCDTIFMADGATLADPHVRVGIVAGDGGVAIWPLVLGPARAKQYLLTGDPVSARRGRTDRPREPRRRPGSAGGRGARLRPAAGGRGSAGGPLHQDRDQQAREGCAERRIRHVHRARARDASAARTTTRRWRRSARSGRRAFGAADRRVRSPGPRAPDREARWTSTMR